MKFDLNPLGVVAVGATTHLALSHFAALHSSANQDDAALYQVKLKGGKIGHFLCHSSTQSLPFSPLSGRNTPEQCDLTPEAHASFGTLSEDEMLSISSGATLSAPVFASTCGDCENVSISNHKPLLGHCSVCSAALPEPTDTEVSLSASDDEDDFEEDALESEDLSEGAEVGGRVTQEKLDALDDDQREAIAAQVALALGEDSIDLSDISVFDDKTLDQITEACEAVCGSALDTSGDDDTSESTANLSQSSVDKINGAFAAEAGADCDDDEEDDEDDEDDYEEDDEDYDSESSAHGADKADGDQTPNEPEVKKTSESSSDDDFLGDDDDEEDDADDEEEVNEDSIVSVSTATVFDGKTSKQMSLSLVYQPSNIPGQSRWYAIANNYPAAVATVESAHAANPELAQSFDNEAFGVGVETVAAQIGINEALASGGFTPFKFDLPLRKVIDAKVAEASAKIEEDARAQVQHVNEGIQAAVTTAYLGLSSGFFKDTDNPIQVAIFDRVYSTLCNAGMDKVSAHHEAVASANAIMEASGEDFGRLLMSQAFSLIEMPVEARNAITRSIVGSNPNSSLSASLSARLAG